MGAKYEESVILDMDLMLGESDTRSPMICFLTMGSDPTENIERLAKQKGIRKYSSSILATIMVSKIVQYLHINFHTV